MRRRGFLKALGALPVVGVVAAKAQKAEQAEAAIEVQPVMNSYSWSLPPRAELRILRELAERDDEAMRRRIAEAYKNVTGQELSGGTAGER